MMKTKINQKHQNQGGQKKDKQMMKKDKQKNTKIKEDKTMIKKWSKKGSTKKHQNEGG